MIEPTPARMLWFFPSIEAGRDPNGQPLAAILAKVLDDRHVNLTVVHGDGSIYPAQNVQLLQDDDEAPETAYACWMPYQKGQAAKHDAPAAVPTLTPEQLTSIHHALDQLATGTDAKFAALGASLTSTLESVFKRLGALEAPAEPNKPAPASPADASLNSV